MNSEKLKIALAVLFLAVDLFFMYKIATITASENTFSDAEIEEAVALISDKGINISAENILKEKKSPNTLKLDWDVPSIDRVAKEIFDSEYGSFKIPKGHSFTNDEERFSVFYDYSFEYTGPGNSENLDTIKAALNSKNATNSKKIKKYEKQLRELFKSKSKNFIIFTEISRLSEIGTKDYIHVVQYVNGHIVNNAGFVAAFEGGNLTYAIGTFYLSDKVSNYSTNSYDSINILFQLDASENEIAKIERQYFPVSENESSLYLTPSYKFTYDDGNYVLLDATSGIKRK